MNGTCIKIKKKANRIFTAGRGSGDRASTVVTVTTKGHTVGLQPMVHQVVLGGPLPRFQIVYTPR
jgi:hypothetical protein